MEGIVYKSTGSWYLVKDTLANFWKCRLKGKFKLDEAIRSSNPIAVGDVVHFDVENKLECSATIYEIENRKNYVARESPQNRNLKHIIASNLDQSILMATLKQPRTSTGFIDRFLLSCEMHHIPAIILFNKMDIYNSDDKEQYLHLYNLYTSLGYEVLLLSAKEGNGLQGLLNLLQGKKSLISGHSGVGKSTLVNQLMPHLHMLTQEVSSWSGKGLHTTTFAEMHDLNAQSQLIDTPGIRELGLVEIEKEEVGGYFPEIRRLMPQCKFSNCLHLNEPQCAIKNALASNEIFAERYENYLSILSGISENNY